MWHAKHVKESASSVFCFTGADQSTNRKRETHKTSKEKDVKARRIGYRKDVVCAWDMRSKMSNDANFVKQERHFPVKLLSSERERKRVPNAIWFQFC